MKFASTITRALRHRNYRLFFSGQTISLIGTWLTRVASSWLVYRLSHSAFILGVVGFAGQIPTFLFAPVAGVLVDRWSRYRVLVWTQVLAMVQSALLAILTVTGVITVGEVIALSLFQGLINAFDMPARQAFVVEMIEDRNDLPNAIALNSSMVNMARLIGPTCAGILIAVIGEGGCFSIDAVSYIAVIVSLLMMNVKRPRKEKSANSKIFAELYEGFLYSIKSKPIRAILILLSLVSLMGMPYMVLLPMVVTEQLHAGAKTLGYITSASGLGALAGVLYLASRKTVRGLGRIIALSSALFGIGLIAFGFSRLTWLSFLFMLVTGLGMMVQFAASNTILQTIVDEDKRGRVMSQYTMAVVGMTPFGSLLCGYMAEKIGSAYTLVICGICCLLGSAVFMKALPGIREHVRPIYRRLGIIPEVAQGLQSATQLDVRPET